MLLVFIPDCFYFLEVFNVFYCILFLFIWFYLISFYFFIIIFLILSFSFSMLLYWWMVEHRTLFVLTLDQVPAEQIQCEFCRNVKCSYSVCEININKLTLNLKVTLATVSLLANISYSRLVRLLLAWLSGLVKQQILVYQILNSRNGTKLLVTGSGCIFTHSGNKSGFWFESDRSHFSIGP